MRELEDSLIDKGMVLVAGIDEAGRGPLAGPVVSAAVIFPPGYTCSAIKDSKKLTAPKREALLKTIFQDTLSLGVGIVSERLVDRLNIREATKLSMARAVHSLDASPDYLLIDGNFTINLPIPQKAIVKGDSLSLSIAAASIVAKVTRDHLMTRLDDRFPQYEFLKHKGYGTKLHLEKIRAHGPCEAHRHTFKGVKEWLGTRVPTEEKA